MKALKKDIDENKQNIFKNLCSIQRNAEAIGEIKEGTDVYNNMLCRQDATIKRLIVALCIAIIAIMLSNAIWLLVLSAKGDTTIIAREGVANVVGHDGRIGP